MLASMRTWLPWSLRVFSPGGSVASAIAQTQRNAGAPGFVWLCDPNGYDFETVKFGTLWRWFAVDIPPEPGTTKPLPSVSNSSSRTPSWKPAVSPINGVAELGVEGQRFRGDERARPTTAAKHAPARSPRRHGSLLRPGLRPSC
jgi:hypothetical protein